MELHLSDDMVELLKSGRINNRLLCEIATHEDFVTLMTDTEIYVDGVATSDFQNFNSLLEVLRGQVLSQYQPVEEDTALKALAVPGSFLDVFTALMCTQLQIRYEKLSEQERTVLKNVMKKTPAYKDSPLSRMKRK